MWFTEVLCNSFIRPQGSFFHSQFLLPRICCQLGAVGVDAALMGGPVCPVDDQAQGLVRGGGWEKRTGQWASAAYKEGGSNGTPATAKGSGHAWTADAQKEPSVSRWQGPRHSAAIPQQGHGTCSPAAPGHSSIWRRCSDLPSETRRPGVRFGWLLHFLFCSVA